MVNHLVLFDIDGTLVYGGPAKAAFEWALERVFGTAGRAKLHNFAGKTDPQIARELLRDEGLADDDIDAGLEELWTSYLGELELRLPREPMTVLPGVRELLPMLETRGDVVLGLLTGNIVHGARLKLGSVGLMDHFSVGGYGSDSEVREDLPAVAMKRAELHWGQAFAASSVVVVGDTPRDVQCGRHGGTRTVAVATGRYTAEELRGAGPDVVLTDMGDLEGAVAAFLP